VEAQLHLCVVEFFLVIIFHLTALISVFGPQMSGADMGFDGRAGGGDDKTARPGTLEH